MLVYIREAHPDSVLFVARDGEETLEKVLQTDTIDARAANAQICCETLKLSFGAVLDLDDNAVNEAYSGWPDRFAIVGTDGRIAYYGKEGPAGFKPNEVEEWLKENTRP